MDSPREPLPSLPDDAEALRALVLAALAERGAVAGIREMLPPGMVRSRRQPACHFPGG